MVDIASECVYNVYQGLKMKGYLKILEAARFMSVTPQTLRNWDKQGKLSPYRHPMNNYRMYKQAELEKILKKIRK